MSLKISSVLFILTLIINQSCSSSMEEAIFISTKKVEVRNNNELITGGVIIIRDYDIILEKGIIWAGFLNPDLINNDGQIIDLSEEKDFTSVISFTHEDEIIYFKAYMITEKDTIYGNQLIFNPLAINYYKDQTAVITKKPSKISSEKAVLGGIVQNLSIEKFSNYEVGLVWGINPNPSLINDSFSKDLLLQNNFVTVITDLEPNQVYYTRAFIKFKNDTLYGNEISFRTYYDTVEDIDGNKYNAKKFGDLVWMVENLRTTHYRDGKRIANITNTRIWNEIEIGSFAFLNNEIYNREEYGVIYNWHAVESGKICPQGWSVPSDDNWKELILFLREEFYNDNNLNIQESSHYSNSGNNSAIDFLRNYGFNLKPGGLIYDGSFLGEGNNTYYWSSTEVSQKNALSIFLSNVDSKVIYSNPFSKKSGCYVLCIKDQP